MTDTLERSEIDKVIARVQKMLSRTKDGSGTTEAEADTALKMAQELMGKYNLDMAVIEAAQGPTSTVVERVKEQVTSKAMYKWQRQLAKYVAEANFCYYLLKAEHSYTTGWFELDEEWQTRPEAIGMEIRITGAQRNALASFDLRNMYTRAVDSRSKTTHSHVFVGRKANVITAQLMFQYLTQTIESLALVEMKDEHHLSRSSFSWKEGCSDRICERLAERRKDLIEEHDARAKAFADERKAEAQRKREEMSKVAKGLPAHHESEVKAQYEKLGNEARQGYSSEADEDEPERPEIDESDIWTPSGEEVYYRLVSALIVPNNANEYDKVQALITTARYAGLIDWSAIEDRNREPSKPQEWSGGRAILDSASRSFRLNRWEGQPFYLELWVEKAALAGVLGPISNDYHITLMVNRGYSSASAMRESAERIRAFSAPTRQAPSFYQRPVVLYVGDHDPSGEDMVRDVKDRLLEFGVSGSLDVRKLALTMAQIEQHVPPPNPVKVTDGRAAAYIEKYGNESWEVDALPPATLELLIRQAINAYVDKPRMEAAITRENKIKAKIKSFAASFKDDL